MKRKILLLAVLLIGAVTQKNYAQASWTGNTWLGTYYLGYNSANDLLFKLGSTPTQYMDLQTGTGYLGIGNTFAPAHLLDVSGGDINVNTTTKGYMIGGNYVLWHHGNTSNIFVGVGAGNTNAMIRSTYVGYDAGNQVQTNDNTGIGYDALAANTYGYDNTAVGGYALASQNFGSSPNSTDNTAVGWAALFSNNPSSNVTGEGNTAIGAWAMYFNQTGPSNTAVGTNALFSNTTAGNNTAIGYRAMLNSTVDSNNASLGFLNMLDNTTGNYNSSLGSRAFENNTTGSYNSSIGYEALYNNSSNTGSYNCALGSQADVSGSGLQYATAIGATAVAAASHQMELGENNATVTIGMSTFAPTATTRLEINTAKGTTPFTVSFTTPSPVAPSPAEGWSGLRFDDLTSGSTPGTNPGPGVLALNSSGDVIYVNPSIGTCVNPTTLSSSNGAIDMANVANFYFLGNGSGNTSVNNVAIGLTCSVTPTAKLDVYQNSGVTTGSTGLYVENDDAANITNPTIGIKSIMSPISCYSSAYPKVAGWFESEYCPSPNEFSYAIYVPWINTANSPGIESIGFPWGFYNGYGDWLQVQTGIFAPSVNYYSDRRYKQHFTSITNAIGKIDSLKPTYYYFDTTGYYDTIYHFSSKQQVGFIAQNVDSVLPQVVQVNDSGYYAMDYAKMTALIVAGMQQQQGMINQDSLKNLSQQNTIDSLRTELNNLTTSYDSVRSVFLSYLSCIKSLCGSSGGDGVIAPGNGNSNNNNNPNLNTQNITLSGSIGGAPLLYQNMPNPFGTGGTKINYYLPEGTMGATIVFYDTYGNMLKTVQLSQTGNGTLNITPDNLSNGIYSYSLIVNGSVIDTKKMLLQK